MEEYSKEELKTNDLKKQESVKYTKREIVKNMLRENIDISLISRVVDLTEAEIIDIKTSN